jgi:hypothetical protein
LTQRLLCQIFSRRKSVKVFAANGQVQTTYGRLGKTTQRRAIFVGDRFLRVWLSLLTALWVVTFIAVFGLIRSENLRVSRIELVNSQGKVVAVLGVSPSDGGVLLLYDANGTLRAAIGMTTENNAAIDLNDGNGNQRVAIQVNDDGTVSAKGLRVR